jgi:hypothetical protein
LLSTTQQACLPCPSSRSILPLFTTWASSLFFLYFCAHFCNTLLPAACC